LNPHRLKKKVCLVILDGWGHGKKDKSNAIFMANTPFVDSLYLQCPNAELRTDGENVGLPDGQMGNSEVGHMNIGAGRIFYQDLVRINLAIRDGSFLNNPVLVESMRKAKSGQRNLHLIGLVSNGGVHSHIEHLKALCTLAHHYGLKDVFIHAFTDGRDCDPKSGEGFLVELENHLTKTTGRIVSVCGRYFAMDRDKRWERISEAYNLLVHGKGKNFNSAEAAIKQHYSEGITDEFILPSVIGNVETIKDDDVVICFNFRTDRCREITQVLTQSANHEYNMHPLNLHYVTMTNYDDSFEKVDAAFEKDHLENTLGEVISKSGRTQLRIAETEKYPHVTFFFNGGREENFPGEKRIMIPSPKVATYDMKPDMSANEVADAACAEMKESSPDFICLNFANPDMVGHTGVFDAIVKAVETTDECVKKVVETGTANGYSFIIIADHGNAEFAVNEDGTPNTAHTTNPVPVMVIDEGIKNVSNGILADIAPTILHLMRIEIPEVIKGKSLTA